MLKIGFLLLSFLLLSFLTGCISTKLEIKTTYPWEGHYMSVEEFVSNESVKNISLKEGDSIWLISNDTIQLILGN